jgi:predicted nuclease of predicted toxin-antitoxin system
VTRLLFDENLSFRLVTHLADLYPQSRHVRDVGLLDHADEDLWRYAADAGYILVTKDTDFYQRSMVRGAPPKVIWVHIGNATTQAAAEVLRSRFLLIQRFVEDPDASFLELRPERRL